jgi:hypothetical protein
MEKEVRVEISASHGFTALCDLLRKGKRRVVRLFSCDDSWTSGAAGTTNPTGNKATADVFV